MKKLRTLLLGEYPELDLLATESDRERVWQHAMKHTQVPSYWVGFFLIFFFGSILLRWATDSVFSLLSLSVPGPWTGNIVQGLISAPILTVVLIMLRRLHRRRIEKSLREQLVGQGIAVCLGCGYDLRGSDSGRCPECGMEGKRPASHEPGGGE